MNDLQDKIIPVFLKRRCFFRNCKGKIMEKQNSYGKIALYIPLLEGGGAERIFVNLANEFARRGFCVDLILNQKKGPYLSNIEKRVDVIELGPGRTLFCILPLGLLLKKSNPDVLITALDHTNMAAVIVKYLFFLKTKIILTRHVYSEGGEKPSGIKNKFRLLTRFLLYRGADKLVAVSEGVANSLVNEIKIKREAVEVIYNPLVDDAISVMKEEDVKHPWFGENKKNHRIIISAGRLVPLKNFPVLIKAFAYLNRKKGNLKLVILGEGSELKRLKALAERLGVGGSVSFPGFINNPYAYITNSDVFALSSNLEGCPNVLVEALACGTPVVSTDCPSGPSEILQNGKYGKLVPMGDYKAFAEALEDVLENPPDSAFLEKRSWDFSVSKNTGKYLNLLFPGMGGEV
jgi:glycosyltransferase involved in cell wall biosynthesis